MSVILSLESMLLFVSFCCLKSARRPIRGGIVAVHSKVILDQKILSSYPFQPVNVYHLTLSTCQCLSSYPFQPVSVYHLTPFNLPVSVYHLTPFNQSMSVTLPLSTCQCLSPYPFHLSPHLLERDTAASTRIQPVAEVRLSVSGWVVLCCLMSSDVG